jgi:hypothetical protein
MRRRYTVGELDEHVLGVDHRCSKLVSEPSAREFNFRVLIDD